MMAHVLMAVLAASPQQNLFTPGEWSSETIAVTVDICIGKLMDGDPKETRFTALVFCGCTVDAIRANSKDNPHPPYNNATQEQLQRCHDLAERRGKDAKPLKHGKTGT
jgi:hypothetical protein